MARHPVGLPPAIEALDRTVVMGVVNVTPDSFSDGGNYFDEDAAVNRGIELHKTGADIVDVGGESTRPGAKRISPEEEKERVLPVIAQLSDQHIATSVDTMRADVARAAVERGACLVNDVSGGMADPEMLQTVAELEVPVVLMHWRSHSDSMDQNTSYGDVVVEVRDHLRDRIAAAETAGISLDRIVIDPGLGFAKEPQHNWQLLGALDVLQELGRPLLLGASRKRFLGALLVDKGQDPRPIDQRDAATHAVSALSAASGAWGVRVHDVSGTLDAVKVAAAWEASAQHG